MAIGVKVQIWRDYGLRVSRKKVARLMRELGLQAAPIRRKVRTATLACRPIPSLVLGLVVRPKQVWVCNLT